MKLKVITDSIEVWDGWRKNYKHFVPKFIEEAKSKTDWKDWDKAVFTEYFERSNDQCVSSLKQGYFFKTEQEAIKNNWDSIASLLKQIANSQDKPLFDVYEEIQKNIRKFTKSNKKAATYRLIAGLQPQLLCTVVNRDNLVEIFNKLKSNDIEEVPNVTNDWFRDSYNLVKFFQSQIPDSNPMDLITYPWQTKVYFDELNLKTKTIDSPNNDMSEDEDISEIVELLKYKKQIILQGPPGTGKTKLANEIAADLIFNDTDKDDKELSEETIRKYMMPGLKFPSAKDKLEYVVEKVNNGSVSVIASTGKPYTPLFKEIIEAYKKTVWEFEGEIKKGNDSYSAAIAKYIYLKQLENKENYSDSEQYKFIQFHPSYTYEDFVRGIEARPSLDGTGVLYENINKTITKIAIKARENLELYNLSLLNREKTEKLIEIKNNFQSFVNHTQTLISESSEQKFPISDSIYLFDSDENRFKYKGDNWIAHIKGLNMKFSELLKLIESNVKERSEIKDVVGIESLTKQHATYFFNTIQKYYDFVNDYELIKKQKSVSTEIKLKNYVVIIDEINRANLSSVLGELIYALEYRGKPAEIMYDIDGDNKLILPPNLYIIGTMNTADRSVGHIDYAIRRRFAFHDVLPKDLTSTIGDKFAQSLFKQVSSLFNHKTYLSKEFDAKDVQLGHSYFIDKTEDGGSMEIRLKYEIKPILLEYVKDGILIGDGILDEIEGLNVDNE